MKTTAKTPQTTDFTRDTVGRFVCNGLDEALQSTPKSGLNPQGSTRLDARDFDLVVIGGGTFGCAIAEHMWFRDAARYHRILILEGGPMFLPEHVQNMPLTRVDVAGATSIKDLRDKNQFGWDKPQREVWGLPWHSNQTFPGLAYCVGGRSVYWGGWSPELLESETPAAWPATVLTDLRNRYFKEASDQIGVTETNDFIFGDLHKALREQLFQKISTVTDAINPTLDPATDPNALPDHPAVRFASKPPTDPELAEFLGLTDADTWPKAPMMRARLKIEAPLAVQAGVSHAGFFPFNKFSSIPLLVKASRSAYDESVGATGQGDDILKRLMIVPQCHVSRLVTSREGSEWRVTAIETNQGTVPLPASGKVIVALGTIESTRLALNSFRDIHADAYARIGNNLMAHLRSNLNVLVPRTAIPGLPAASNALQASALFVKGRHPLKDKNGNVAGQGHFHLQITASGGQRGVGSEAELFKKIPDIDTLQAHLNPAIPDSHVAITIRGIGEMQPQNPANFVKPDGEVEPESGAQRVFVKIDDPRQADLRLNNPKTDQDGQLWDAMDETARQVAAVFTGKPLAEIPNPARDTLGTTHHETGTLWMGDTTNSVTDRDCKFRHITNAYVAGPALFPTIGSPNPMLTGIALARRLGDHLAVPKPFEAPDGFTVLFNGFDVRKWQMTTITKQAADRSNPGHFRIVNGTLEAVAGNDMGILWYTEPTPANFILRLQWLRWTQETNSGVYVRFPKPDSKGYSNTAFVADDFGFEIQIDENARPDGADIHRTGAIYRKDNRTDGETLSLKPARAVGEWNDYEIQVKGQLYTVKLNGETVCMFDNTNRYPNRGLPTPAYIGLQCYADPNSRIAFRHIRIKEIT